MARNSVFTNIDEEIFVGEWDGNKRSFKPGESKILPEWLAEHYAKHLANHMLIKSGIAKNESYTSPKKPSDVPAFKELFDEICQPHGEREKDAERDELDAEIELLNSDIPKQDDEDETMHTEEGVDASDDEYDEDEEDEKEEMERDEEDKPDEEDAKKVENEEKDEADSEESVK